MIIQIQATAATLTADEVRDAIPAETMAEIKRKDSNPLFQAYSLVQEGVSNPKEVGANQSQAIAWPRKAIQTVSNVLKKGLQFFDGHNDDNSTNGRKPLADFVGRLAKEVGGRLHEIVIGYFPDKSIANNYDVCSIEADISASEIPGGMTIAEGIDRITGIALGNSAHDVPAFAGAKKLLSVQCFDKIKKIQGNETPPEEIHMTFAEWKAKLSEYNVHPSDIFTIDEIQKDREFSHVFDARDAFKKENDELKETAKTTGEKVAKQEKDILRNDARKRLETFIPTDATKGQKDLISKRVEKKFDKMDDYSDEALKSFVNEQIEDYNDFGAKDDGETEELDDNGEKKKPEQSEGKSIVDEAVEDAIGNTKE